jgi:hypothetical protein
MDAAPLLVVGMMILSIGVISAIISNWESDQRHY